jgi:hypothetical protein
MKSMYRFTAMLLSALAAGPLLAQTTTTPSARQYGFAPIGLGSTETAEVIVVNTAANSSSGTAASCTGSISFYNASGAVIGSATPFTVTSGQIATARLPFASSGGTGTHTVIRAVVSVTPPTASPRPPCSLVFSLDTFDTSTGAIHAVVPSLASSFRD